MVPIVLENLTRFTCLAMEYILSRFGMYLYRIGCHNQHFLLACYKGTPEYTLLLLTCCSKPTDVKTMDHHFLLCISMWRSQIESLSSVECPIVVDNLYSFQHHIAITAVGNMALRAENFLNSSALPQA